MLRTPLTPSLRETPRYAVVVPHFRLTQIVRTLPEAGMLMTVVDTPSADLEDGSGTDVSLPRLGSRLAMRARAIWAVRGLIREFTFRDLRVRYHQAVLGVAWALLMPVLVVLAGLVIRTVVAGSNGSTGMGSISGIIVKAVPWSFFAGALGFATSSLTANAVLVAKVYFPREALPLATVLAQCVDLAAGVIMVTLVLAVRGVDITVNLLWALPLLVLLVLLTAAASLLAACANLFFRDVRYLVQVLLTFGIFFTPVFYDASRLGEQGARIVMLNPLAPILEGLRLAVVHGHSLLVPLVEGGVTVWSPWTLAYSAAWAIGGLLAAALLYERLELSFAEYL